ncbi:hypothetical protein [Muricomes intestini]|uniref:hypothetical protein n=1 Tax=Muricomes intestini TaxID=1796634 RepID=UPI002FDECA12
MIRGILILVFMLLMIILMVSGKWPTLAALPVLAIGIAVIAGVPLMAAEGEANILTTVVQDGATKLVATIMVVLVASWLGSLMQTTGISEHIIRKAAEFGGDKTTLVAIVMFIIVCVLTTSMTGLGAVMMIATIAVPILISVGVDKVTAASIVLLGLGVGEHLGVLRATYFADVFSLPIKQVYPISATLAISTAVFSLIYILLRLRKHGKKYAFSANASEYKEDILEEKNDFKGVKGVLALLTPFVPIVLAIVVKWPIFPAFMVAVVWGLIFTQNNFKKAMSVMAQTCYDGFSQGAPAIILMIFIGMLLNAINTPQVLAALTPLAKAVMPGSIVVLAVTFIVLAPLALYRGPLSIMGLGAGIALLMVSMKVFSPVIICICFFGVAGLTETTCPTASYNIWISDFIEVETITLTKKQLPWVWLGAAATIIICMFMYY